MALPEAQDGGRMLTEAVVGSGDHDRFGDRGHAHQNLFDLERADVLAAANDDVGLAVGDGQIAVVVEHADVARAIPAVAVEGCAVSLVIGVAEAEIGTATEDLAVVAEPDLHARPDVSVGEQPLVLGCAAAANR